MADKAFGVKDFNLIGASGTPTIESPNNLNINAVNVAISTDITVAGKVSLGTGTSISSPGTNILTLGTNSAERLRIDSAGNMGLGVSPIAPGSLAFHLGETTSSQPVRLHMTTANTGATASDGFTLSIDGSSSVVNMIQRENAAIQFYTNNSERMRLASNGEHMVYSDGTASALRTAAASSGSAEILYCAHSSSSVTVGTGVYAIYSNGSASSLSDRTQKKNIETTRDGYLEDLNRLRVVKYNWNDQEDGTPKELGLIAQEVEEVFPGLISNMRSDVGIGTTASNKGIKTSVLPYMLLKALQEANAEIAALSARITALENP